MKMVILECSQCNTKIEKEKRRYDSYERLEGKGKHKYFCSQKCQNEFKKTGKYVKCAKCDKKVYRIHSALEKSKSGKSFCSKSCSTSYWNKYLKTGKQNSNYTSGIGSYRLRAIEKFGTKCKFCKYDNEIIIQVHHKDKDRDNNSLDNLLIVCPTHHREIHLGVLEI